MVRCRSDENPAGLEKPQGYLYFGAVDESCRVFVNGQKAGEHLNEWKTPFAIEITKCLNWDLPSRIVIVRVEDKFGAGGI